MPSSDRSAAGRVGMQRRPGVIVVLLVFVVVLGVGVCAGAPDLETAERQYRTGKYTECLETTVQAIREGVFSMQWHLLLIRSQMALGLYEDAAKSVEAALQDYTFSIRLMLLAHEVFAANGRLDRADEMLATIYRIAGDRRVGYMTGREMVALGQTLLKMGAEPRRVLDQFYHRVLQNDPNCREAYEAIGELAIAKQDYAMAADQYREAIRRFGDDPAFHTGLARAFYHSDRRAMLGALSDALEVNPNYADALILLAEHQIDCEDYRAAFDTLDSVLMVNPWHPRAWAYEAVLARLGNDPDGAENRRSQALKYWRTNPEVDYLIGRKLSQNYRFSEGSTHQRQALVYDPNYLPAKLQLAGDMLRLGIDDEGWRLVEQVHAADAYNVEAYNLASLRDKMAGYRTLEADGFLVRMAAKEAAVYGDRVFKLLREARDVLCERYGCALRAPVTVEIFENQQDFAVRTFGMPGGDGFLGVCFGNVITANSPKAAVPTNWEAMLWHEFAHVVTLNLTANKMPRWLSEGISVYEELRRDPTWGQRMNPTYRKMVLDGQLTPVSQLSSAFMDPPTPMHLQFAYYQASLVVEYLVERYGMESLWAILKDLGEGQRVNEAISRHAEAIERVENDFALFAKARAQGLGEGVDWTEPPRGQVDVRDVNAVATWLEGHPNNYWGLRTYAGLLLADEQWERAKKPLEKLIELYPGDTGDGNAYLRLAQAHRELEQVEDEAKVLGKLAQASSDVGPAYVRLMEIGMERQDWEAVAVNGRRYLAVYPMLGTTYLHLGRAYEGLGRTHEAIGAYQRVLLLDPADPVDAHYRLARLYRSSDLRAARQHVLEALADAPRFREGHKLLLEIVEESEDRSKE